MNVLLPQALYISNPDLKKGYVVLTVCSDNTSSTSL